MVTDSQLSELWEMLTAEQKSSLMRDLLRDVQSDKKQKELHRYHGEIGIIRFVKEQLGATPYPYQERVLRAIVKHKKLAILAPHGSGKSTIAAWFILWLMTVYEDVKVPVLCPTDRQNSYIFSEIKKWARRLPDKDFRILSRRLDGYANSAFAVSSNDPAYIEGIHASNVAWVYDEAKAIDAPFWFASEGAMSNADGDLFEGYWLAISTPGAPSGTFYDICSRKKGYSDWEVIHISLKECLKAGSISKKWVNARREQWGETSSVYLNRCLALFSTTDEDSVIPLEWIEQAIERGRNTVLSEHDTITVGCDPARYGTDKTAVAVLHGKTIRPISYTSKQSTMETSGRIASRFNKKIPIAIDVIGIGSGVFDRLRELQFNVTPVNVAEAARSDRGDPLTDITGTLEFFNLRSYLLWHLRDMLNPDNEDAIGLPDDPKLIGDLCTPQYRYTSSGKIQVESKKDIRKRLKRSTDGADAVALALYARDNQPEEHTITVTYYA